MEKELKPAHEIPSQVDNVSHLGVAGKREGQTTGDESPCPGADTHGDHVIMLFSSQPLLLCLLAEVKLNVSPSAYVPPPPTPEHHAVLTPHSHELCDIGKYIACKIFILKYR